MRGDPGPERRLRCGNDAPQRPQQRAVIVLVPDEVREEQEGPAAHGAQGAAPSVVVNDGFNLGVVVGGGLHDAGQERPGLGHVGQGD